MSLFAKKKTKTVRFPFNVDLSIYGSGVSAEYGRVTGYAKSEGEALDDWRRNLETLVSNDASPVYRFAENVVFVLYHSGSGWCYDIVHLDTRHVSSTVFGHGTTKQEAVAAMERHVAQYDEPAPQEVTA